MPEGNTQQSSSNMCKRCNNPVTTGHKCRTCGIVSHKSCLKTIKAKFYEDSTVDCCLHPPVTSKSTNATTNSSTNISLDVEKAVEQIRITYLEEIIRQKDLVISNQAMLIESLQVQITFLNREVSSHAVDVHPNPKTASYSKTASSSKVLSNEKEKAKHSNKQLNIAQENKGTSQIAATTVSHAIHTAHTSQLCHDIVNLTSDIKLNSKSNPRNLFVGNAESDSVISSFKSAKITQMRHFHVTNCDPETTKETLMLYLKDIVPNVQIEMLKSRNPTLYSSFKISIPKLEAPKILKPELWPSGVMVNQFFRAKRQSKVEASNT